MRKKGLDTRFGGDASSGAGLLHLINTKQRLPDGRMRERRQLLSEKMFHDEEPAEAARRAVMEELGSALGKGTDITIPPTSLLSWYAHAHTS